MKTPLITLVLLLLLAFFTSCQDKTEPAAQPAKEKEPVASEQPSSTPADKPPAEETAKPPSDEELRRQGQRTGGMDVILATNNIVVKPGETFEIAIEFSLGEGVCLFGAMESTFAPVMLNRPAAAWIDYWEPLTPDGVEVERENGAYWELTGRQRIAAHCRVTEEMPEGAVKLEVPLSMAVRTRGLVSPEVRRMVAVTLIR